MDIKAIGTVLILILSIPTFIGIIYISTLPSKQLAGDITAEEAIEEEVKTLTDIIIPWWVGLLQTFQDNPFIISIILFVIIILAIIFGKEAIT